jgi:ketol-acid reductoisomerase
MPDSVFRFHIGLRKGSKSFEEARAAGFQTSSINHDYQSNSYTVLYQLQSNVVQNSAIRQFWNALHIQDSALSIGWRNFK